MKQKDQILIVEDEAAIRTGLIDVFVYHGYEVDFAERGDDGLKKALNGNYDLILLDVMMPGMNGFDVCQKIREHDKKQGTDQAIIMLTAKSNDEDIIEGLSLGADDYISKPFSVAQLVLRVQAVLRRTKATTAHKNTQIHLANDLIIDCQNLDADKLDTTNQSMKITFTRKEIEILQYLQENTERPVSRDELLNKVWGYASDLELETRTVDIHIAKLRRKIETNPSQPECLVTVRGAGYRLLTKPVS